MPNNHHPNPAIAVAVAVIAFTTNHATYATPQYLLARRHAHQHQGDRYEFVGGKIEAGETAQQALVREVREELGVDMAGNDWAQLGVIRHDYGDKSVCLHVFHTHATPKQVARLQGQGCEGQALVWAEFDDMVKGNYPLPDANARIVDWLGLPQVIVISRDMATNPNRMPNINANDINANDINANDIDAWISDYTKKLPQNAWLYLRLPNVLARPDGMHVYIEIWQALRKNRPDVTFLQNMQLFEVLTQNGFDLSKTVLHLNHQQLMTSAPSDLSSACGYFASCHDALSLNKINQIAQNHVVMGAFLSPVLPTPTHPEAPTLGWQGFAELAMDSDVPIFALGGLSVKDLMTVQAHGGYGVAGIRFIDHL